ncbi:hypothetical protein HMF8227_01071 [Saliniradius amylolyticus]|uniref:Uncharacterized protein n=1 Tax=Saliniradius amylolyticus TaxID=2183582 RepID=A0A2S2E1P5_9ALTE|nr:hypothetical protein [Saliniradius amylolyticus]AWL11558.1 hypothetical protein HMF8227_01071 [Saliniradius amylolyticus]
MTLFYILGILLVALLILVPLLEKANLQFSPKTMSTMSRWVLPLVAILLILQLVRYML